MLSAKWLTFFSRGSWVKWVLLRKSWPHSRILTKYSWEWRYKGTAGGMCSGNYTRFLYWSPELHSTLLGIADWLWCRFQMELFERHLLDSTPDADPSTLPCEKGGKHLSKGAWWLYKHVTICLWTESLMSTFNEAHSLGNMIIDGFNSSC